MKYDFQTISRVREGGGRGWWYRGAFEWVLGALYEMCYVSLSSEQNLKNECFELRMKRSWMLYENIAL